METQSIMVEDLVIRIETLEQQVQAIVNLLAARERVEAKQAST